MELAQQEAISRGHQVLIPPLHLLAALLAQEQGLATRFIQEIGGVDHRQLNRELDKLLGKIPPCIRLSGGTLQMSSSLARVFTGQSRKQNSSWMNI